MKRLAILFFLSLAACEAPSGKALKPFSRVDVQSVTTSVVAAMARRDLETLAGFVGEEGLIVSPYVMLDQGDLRLSRAEVEHCGSDAQIRLWGYRDGSGSPIETTCKSYFDEFVWNADYREAHEVLYDEPRQRGNEVNNNHDFVPGGVVVELHIRGQGGQKAMNWKSLRLIFRKGEQGLFLIAITRDVWTI